MISRQNEKKTFYSSFSSHGLGQCIRYANEVEILDVHFRLQHRLSNKTIMTILYEEFPCTHWKSIRVNIELPPEALFWLAKVVPCRQLHERKFLSTLLMLHPITDDFPITECTYWSYMRHLYLWRKATRFWLCLESGRMNVNQMESA